MPKLYRTKPDWTLRVVGEINVDALAERVSRITPEEWDEWKQRQKSVHKQARAVPFQWCHNISGYDPDKDDEFNDIKVFPPYEEYKEELDRIYAYLDEIEGPAKMVTSILVNLPSGKIIPDHIDKPDFKIFQRTKRYHIPLITHPDVRFRHSGETWNLEKGKIYELNNIVGRHGVRNASPVDRVHILTDRYPL